MNVPKDTSGSVNQPATSARWNSSLIVPMGIFAILLCIPAVARFGGESYVLSLMTRVVILAIAAMALDLLIGYAGVVSLGHAAYLGLGTYAVGILATHGITDFLTALAVAVAAGAAFSFVTGLIAIRSQGAYFIMITLAFGQMLFFVATALAQYGGDDGMTLAARSRLFGMSYLESDTNLYYLSIAVLIGIYLLLRRIVHSHFGRVVTGSRENATQMQAIGFKPARYRLVAYVIAGTLTTVAGVLLANQAGFVSPSTMTWQRSGDLIFMVVLGGTGTLHGAILGAVVYLVAEELLAQFTEHWPIIFGPLLILSVFVARTGLIQFLSKSGARQ
jgi:branched-chain amino acid transport system permease protein